MSDSVRPHRRQPTRLPHPWESPGKNTGVGCHCLLQCVKVKSLSHVLLLATPWTAAYQAPPSMGFSRQEYWSGLPLPPPPLWYTCLKNPMDRGAWRATGPGPTKGQTATEQKYTCVCVFIHTHEQNKKVFALYQRERLGRL